MDCMSISAVTHLYPALIKQQAKLYEKLVLISPVDQEPVQPQFIVVEISSPDNIDATRWLDNTHYPVKIFILVVPFSSPDGEVIEKRLICVSTDRPMGQVLWNHTNRLMKLEPRPYFPSLATYFCLGERFHNPIKQLNLLKFDIYMRLSSENVLSGSSTRARLANRVRDELLHNVEMPEPQANEVDNDKPANTNSTLLLLAATSGHDHAHLLPADPFDMGFITL